MIRIFLPPEQLSSDKISITGDQARHLSLVLRVTPGESLFIFDGSGHKYNCRVLQCHKKEVVAECLSKEPYSAESPVSITLAQGLPKGDKMDFIIQKSTELGVNRVIPLVTGRSQVKHTHKTERWRRIALSASEQSGRDKIPAIDEPIDFNTFLCSMSQKGGDGGVALNGLIFSEEHQERNLHNTLTAFRNTQHITLLVGPEGGFAKEEISAAVEHGFTEVSLGPRILRTETAPLAAISIIQYELGDIG